MYPVQTRKWSSIVLTKGWVYIVSTFSAGDANHVVR